MDQKIRESCERMNAVLSEITNYKIDIVDISELTLLEKNARFMKKEVFDTLVESISKQGFSSLPFCFYAKDGKKTVLSGNHRIMAAKEAKKKKILVLYTDEEISREEQVTIQLAHNQLTGEDNKQILKELWDEIRTVELKELTGFDDEYFEKFEPIEFSTIKSQGLEFIKTSVLFFREDVEKIRELQDLIGKNAENINFCAKYEDFDVFFNAILEIKEKFEIENTALAIRTMADIAIRELKKNEGKKTETDSAKDSARRKKSKPH